MAKKMRFGQGKAPAGKPAPKPKAVPKPAAAPKAAPVPAAAAPAAAGRVLTDTRKCAHSRAHKAATRMAKKAGKPPHEVRSLASLAGCQAAAEWDIAHSTYL